MRLRLISPISTKSYKANKVPIARWPLPATGLAAASLALISEEGHGRPAARFRPADSRLCQYIGTDIEPASPRRRRRPNMPPPFQTASVTRPTSGSVVHVDSFYHKVAYYAREKFRDSIGYAFLRSKEQALKGLTYYLPVAYDSWGLGREIHFQGGRIRLGRATSNGPSSKPEKAIFLLRKVALPTALFIASRC